jgi:hypothetical protein
MYFMNLVVVFRNRVAFHTRPCDNLPEKYRLHELDDNLTEHR